MRTRTSRGVMRIGLRLASAVAVGTGASVMARGTAAIPGGEAVDPTVDNVLRFYAAWWTGAGLLMWRIAPDTRGNDAHLKGILAVNFVGGLVRLYASRQTGRPHRLFQIIAIEELIFSPLLFAVQKRIMSEASTPGDTRGLPGPIKGAAIDLLPPVPRGRG